MHTLALLESLSPATLGTAVALGLLLSVSCGLRAFVAPLTLAAGARLGWVDLGPSFTWMASDLALCTFGLAVAIELVADKFPAVDHAFDSLHVLVKPALATVAGAALLQGPDTSPLLACVLGLCTSGALAGVTHVTKASVRLGSSATTLGAGNPLLSLGEDVVAVGLTALLTWGAVHA